MSAKKKDDSEPSDKADLIRNHKTKKLRVRKLQKEARLIITKEFTSLLSKQQAMETQDRKIPADFNVTSFAVDKVPKGAYRSILAKLLRFVASLDLNPCKVDQFIF